jgi:hypothetical protein
MVVGVDRRFSVTWLLVVAMGVLLVALVVHQGPVPAGIARVGVGAIGLVSSPVPTSAPQPSSSPNPGGKGGAIATPALSGPQTTPSVGSGKAYRPADSRAVPTSTSAEPAIAAVAMIAILIAIGEVVVIARLRRRVSILSAGSRTETVAASIAGEHA